MVAIRMKSSNTGENNYSVLFFKNFVAYVLCCESTEWYLWGNVCYLNDKLPAFVFVGGLVSLKQGNEATDEDGLNHPC